MLVKDAMTNVRGKSYYVNQRAKFLHHAKEAMTSGDRVLYEYNLQCADHYNRIILEKFTPPVTPGSGEGSPENADADATLVAQAESRPRTFQRRKRSIRPRPKSAQVQIEEDQ